MKDLSTLPPLKEIIHSHGLAARKSLGQHFLLDSNLTDRIAACAGDLTSCHVIEVGPGPGGLTRSLLAAGAKSLTVIEKDGRCIDALQPLKDIAGGRLTILEADALEIDLVAAVPAPRVIVANLPYNVGTPMLIDWLHAIYNHGPQAFASMTLMFQKEVADRITADHGNKDYGRLSVLSQWLCNIRHDMDLPPGAFSPPPKVSSSVITLTPHSKPLVDVDIKALELVVAKAFGQRRKMLRQALKGLAVPADKLLEAAEIDPTRRAEQLDVVTLCNLAKIYQENLQ